MRRIPPPLLALAVVAAVAGIVVALFVATGSGQGRPAPSCSKALADGPYRCVVFVSVSGAQDGADQAWLADGTATYRVVSDGDGLTLLATGGCNTVQWPVTVSRSAYRTTGPASTTLIGCTGGRGAHDEWITALLDGSPTVHEHDDATVTVTNGGRSALFREVIARG